MSNKTDELRVWDRTRATETARNPSRSASPQGPFGAASSAAGPRVSLSICLYLSSTASASTCTITRTGTTLCVCVRRDRQRRGALQPCARLLPPSPPHPPPHHHTTTTTTTSPPPPTRRPPPPGAIVKCEHINIVQQPGLIRHGYAATPRPDCMSGWRRAVLHTPYAIEAFLAPTASLTAAPTVHVDTHWSQRTYSFNTHECRACSAVGVSLG
jgi:hypothetical protein